MISDPSARARIMCPFYGKEFDMISKTINGCTFLDPAKLWKSIESTPTVNKLQKFFINSGVEFHDEACRFISKPVSAICGVGGIPIVISKDHPHDHIALATAPDHSFPMTDLAKSTYSMMGMSAFCSYMNPKGAEPEQLAQTSFDHGHFSVTHVANINMMLLGYSCAVENELNSQRDLMHFSRLTVARTLSQKSPMIVVLNPEHLPLYERITAAIDAVMEEIDQGVPDKDSLESRNLMYSAAKASFVMITSSIRNFQKIMGGITDSGKEMEYRVLLESMNQNLSAVWPQLFK